VLAWQETVAVPDPVMVVGDIAPHVSPVGIESVSETVPVKWLSGDTVMVDVVETPALMGDGDVAEIVKSTTWTGTVT
jgi:hypothetical protein